MPDYRKRVLSGSVSEMPGSAAKKPDVKEAKDKQKKVQQLLSQKLEVVAKLLLWNTQQTRAVLGALMLTLFIPTDSEMAKGIKKSTLEYSVMAKEAKNEGKAAEMGPPHMHALEGWMEGAAKQLEMEKKDEASKMLKQFTEAEAQHMIKIFKLSKAYDGNVKKLQVMAEDDGLGIIRAVMAALNIVPKTGSQPPLGMERVLQRALEGLEEE
mmetsp:Transcript_17013/g.49793  ORF Transcript_17013/g.49793 Transcript_17013/m.49793 type:complete len:211 (-) Transcript_17013:164-796(-)